MPHLPTEEAPSSPPLGQLMGRLAGRVAVTLWRLIQAHQIIQEVNLSSKGVTIASCRGHCRLMLLLGMQALLSGSIILTGKHNITCEVPDCFYREKLQETRRSTGDSPAGFAGKGAVRQDIQECTVSSHCGRHCPPLRTSQCSSCGGPAGASSGSLWSETDLARCSPAMSRSKEEACLSGGTKPAVYHSGTST